MFHKENQEIISKEQSYKRKDSIPLLNNVANFAKVVFVQSNQKRSKEKESQKQFSKLEVGSPAPSEKSSLRRNFSFGKVKSNLKSDSLYELDVDELKGIKDRFKRRGSFASKSHQSNELHVSSACSHQEQKRRGTSLTWKSSQTNELQVSWSNSNKKIKGFRKLNRSLSLMDTEEMLHNFVNERDSKNLQVLLENVKVNVNCLKSPGVAPLHQACVWGNLTSIKILVEYGADVNLNSWQGHSPLKLAVRNGHFDVAVYLIGKGALSDDIKNGF